MKTDCKLGEGFHCNHKLHPKNKSIYDSMLYAAAEVEAFKVAGIEFGTVNFVCPLCGGTATGVLYKYGSEYGATEIGGLGSGCRKCGIMNT